MITCKLHVPEENSPCKFYIKQEPGIAGLCDAEPTMFRCTEALKKLSPTITQSAIKTFAQCPYKYYLNYIKGVSRRDEHLPEPIKMGAVWDAYLGGKDTVELMDRYQISDITQAKLLTMMNVFEELKLTPEPGYDTQGKVEWLAGGNVTVTGFTDRTYSDHIEEDKFTARPDFYFTLGNISLQVGTYFLGVPSAEYVDMKVTRVPGLRLGKEEDIAGYMDRLYKDICKRPSYYFPGLNKAKKTYGKRFYRNEFPLDIIKKRFEDVIKDMRFHIDNNLWYRNELSCHVPSQCMYLDIKNTGVISNTLYKVADKLEEIR